MRRTALVVLVLLVAAIAIRLALPAAARFLIRPQPLAKSDAIVILAGGRLERILEAGTLYREGWSPRIILSHPSDGRSELLVRLHVDIPTMYETQISVLTQMGVPRSAIVDRVHDHQTTREEAIYVASVARQQHYKRLIVVTSAYHTLRAGVLFRRAAKDSTQIIMRPDRYQQIDPQRWWQHPVDRYDVVLEYLKIAHEIASPVFGRLIGTTRTQERIEGLSAILVP